jgi:tetratricopeptide (TPR) repeat protein
MRQSWPRWLARRLRRLARRLRRLLFLRLSWPKWLARRRLRRARLVLAEVLRPSWPGWLERRSLRHARLVFAEGMRPSWRTWLTRRRLRHARLILAEGMRPSWPAWLERRRLRHARLVFAEGMHPSWPGWLKRRRLRRRFLLALLILAALATAAYFAARPVGGAIKAWQSRRLAQQALTFIERKQWNEASTKAHDAYLLRPSEPESWRAIARGLSRMPQRNIRQSSIAFGWWKRVDQEHRLTIEDRRDFARVALAAGELAMAGTQIDQLLAQREGPSPIDILLAGQLAIRRNDLLLTADYAQRVMSDNRAKPNEILSAAILVLSVTTPESAPHINAWKRIEHLARDSGNAASLDALVFLANQQSLAPARSTSIDTFELSAPASQQSVPSSPLTGETSLSLGPSGGAARQPVTSMGLLEIADALEKHPDARPYHRLLAFQLRAQHDPVLTNEYVAQAVERFGKEDDETLAALTAWLNNLGRARKTLELLPLDRAVRNQALFLQHINALGALQRWREVKETLLSRLPLDPVVQHMYLAIAQSHLGEATAATDEWQRAMQAAANNPDKLFALATYAEQKHANDIADAAYAKAIKAAPENRVAYVGRLRIAEASGRTADAQSLVAEIVRIWPDDAAARNRDVYLQLLLGASDGAAEAAERQAQILVAQEPWNWAARATLGLARLRLGKKEEALAAFRGVKATGSEPPGALAVRAAILAVNGYEKGARGDAHNLGAEHLLPEERALIAPLLAD